MLIIIMISARGHNEMGHCHIGDLQGMTSAQALV